MKLLKSLSRRSKGAHYETAAKEYLLGCGLSLIERNFSARTGEIDLIMRDGDTIVFVEVRYRTHQNFGHAAETVTYQKMQKLIRTATRWLQTQNLSVHTTDFRFDVVAIHDNGKQTDWIKNAIVQG
ncbi:hypothetical protein VPR01S_21_00740 [Vibrio proteolyticus NBRC 13287]|uniref:UPF0102 protein VPR01S_21_00740 n=1 Tax=Vibrio proteolyticus NBRC 13287 TaxID=1219065 RepID=U3BH53_VIBPR|nr:hypothetical protein VPR01S_21_00740 [Vibrio proteolyticus NBRC 13287]